MLPQHQQVILAWILPGYRRYQLHAEMQYLCAINPSGLHINSDV
jgi:hypothetical protein